VAAFEHREGPIMSVSSSDRHAFPATSRLAGRLVLVTGAAGGLGRALAHGFARAGADLALLDRDEAAAAALAQELAQAGLSPSALAIAADVANETAVNEAVRHAAGHFGRLDVLVNMAGISPVFARAEQLALSDWQRVIDVNLTGTFLCAKAAAQIMMTQGSGKIINTASVLGGVGAHHLAAYCASKGGVIALTRALAADWARYNIQVNAVAPGYFETPIIAGLKENRRLADEILHRVPQHRFAQPLELVGAYVFLASDESSFVNGETLYVDGGYHAV
jgi:NAD(P)-dependent dehydrogenase (short-subunit alcohol dehydrogenase family)